MRRYSSTSLASSMFTTRKMVVVYSSMKTAGSYKASRNDSSYYGAGSVGFFRFLLKFLGSSEFLKALEGLP
ncbi:hypothetical protein IMY05_010G0077500 [Salix suchowensis]|nr:hypothetical protein IMY05_010G0077500 [Salix suchowensis]